MEHQTVTSLGYEFERQVENLLRKDYPKLSGFSEQDFLIIVEPLKEHAQQLDVPDYDLEAGILPFVIVIKRDLVPTETAMTQVERAGKNGITKLFPREPEDFKPIETVMIPDKQAYLLIDIDRGKANIDLPPCKAMKLIIDAARSPLTIDEGVALVTHFPEFLMKNNCFSLLASRHSSDKRVPAIWINGKKHPNLGWCWDGNPHTWLGSASCLNRIS